MGCDAGNIEREIDGRGVQDDPAQTVARHGAGRVRAVAVVVFGGHAAARIAVDADQLVVAHQRIVIVRVGRVAPAVELAARVGVVVAIAADVRERRMIHVDAGIHDADDHALAAVAARRTGGGRAPRGRRADPARPTVREQLAILARLDVLHAGQRGHNCRLVRRQGEGQAVQDDIVHITDLQLPAEPFAGAPQELGALLGQERQVRLAGRAVDVQLARAGDFDVGGRQIAQPAAIACQRWVDQLDDIRLRFVFLQSGHRAQPGNRGCGGGISGRDDQRHQRHDRREEREASAHQHAPCNGTSIGWTQL